MPRGTESRPHMLVRQPQVANERSPLSDAQIASRRSENGPTVRSFQATLVTTSQSQWDALVETHCAVNRGVRAASNLLLSMRGGIAPQLSTATLDGDKAPSREEVAFRRTLIALSYLTVEDTLNAPEELRVGTTKEFPGKDALSEQLARELADILRSRRVSEEEINEWLVDCGTALSGAIRDDAVWVNRAKGFDQLQQRCGPTLTQDEVWDLLQHVVGSPSEYFDYSAVDKENDADHGNLKTAFEDTSDKVAIACQRWLGQRFGAGQGLDYERLSSFYEGLTESLETGDKDISGELLMRQAAARAGLSLSESLSSGVDASEVALDLSRQLGLKGMATLAFTSAISPIISSSPLSQDERQAACEKITTRLADARKNIGVKGEREWSTAAFVDVTRATGLEYRGPSPRTDTTFGERDRALEFSFILGAAGEKVSALQTNVRKAEANRFSASGALRSYEREVDAERTETIALIRAIETELGERTKQDGYIIRPRSITGWPELVQLWRANGATEQDRLHIVRAELPELLSASNPPVKLGNPQLFELLAKEDHRAIWTTPSGDLTADKLIEYVKYQEALEKISRYKVIRFCHADALEHPVFPQIATRGFKAEFGASSHLSRTRAASDPSYQHGAKKHTRTKALPAAKTISIDLFDGAQLSRHHFRWSSDRFFDQIVNGNNTDPHAVAVSRMTRFGKAAAGVAGDAPVFSDTKAELFARILFDRRKLDRIASKLERRSSTVRDIDTIDALKAMNHDERTRGASLMISAKLTPRGPAHQFGKEHGVNLLAPSVHSEYNKQKGLGALAKRRLSHLPGLRVLGVHFGVGQVALSVWETLSPTDASELMSRHGQKELPEDDVPFVALPGLSNGKSGAPGPVLRRLGANTLTDGETAHPAPWAVHRRSAPLLPPGHKDVRLASNRELKVMQEISDLTGLRPRFLTKRPTILNVMHTASDTIHRALDRQRPLASLAYDLNDVATQGDSDKAKAVFATTLRQWCDLVCKNSSNRSDVLGDTFNTHIGPYLDKSAWVELVAEHGTKRGKSQKYTAARDKLLTSVLHTFADLPQDRANLARLASLELSGSWHARDISIQKALAHARQLIRPSEKFLSEGGDHNKGARNHVGGLSQRRLATLTAYKNVLSSFDRRPSPTDKARGTADKFDAFEASAGKTIQRHIVKLREEYARVMAARIIEAALGLGGEPGTAAPNKQNGSRGRRELPRRTSFNLSDRHGQTPVIVMENLSNYAPIQTQGRKENAQLQRWLSQRVTELVQQQAEEHGVRVELISPHRVSLRDAYTFGTGVRVTQVSVADFVQENGSYVTMREKASERVASGIASHFDKYLVDLMTKWDASARIWEDASGRKWTLRGSTWSSIGAGEGASPQAVMLPDPAGDLFVSENAEVSGRLYRNAEINAAANVALLPVCDPAYPGTWSVVPINAATGTPLDSMKGTPFGPEQSLVKPQVKSAEQASSTKNVRASRGAIPKLKKGANNSNVRNAYRNPLEGNDTWKLYAERMNAVEAQVVETLRRMHGLQKS